MSPAVIPCLPFQFFFKAGSEVITLGGDAWSIGHPSKHCYRETRELRAALCWGELIVLVAQSRGRISPSVPATAKTYRSPVSTNITCSTLALLPRKCGCCKSGGRQQLCSRWCVLQHSACPSRPAVHLPTYLARTCLVSPASSRPAWVAHRVCAGGPQSVCPTGRAALMLPVYTCSSTCSSFCSSSWWRSLRSCLISASVAERPAIATTGHPRRMTRRTTSQCTVGRGVGACCEGGVGAFRRIAAGFTARRSGPPAAQARRGADRMISACKPDAQSGPTVPSPSSQEAHLALVSLENTYYALHALRGLLDWGCTSSIAGGLTASPPPVQLQYSNGFLSLVQNGEAEGPLTHSINMRACSNYNSRDRWVEPPS